MCVFINKSSKNISIIILLLFYLSLSSCYNAKHYNNNNASNNNSNNTIPGTDGILLNEVPPNVPSATDNTNADIQYSGTLLNPNLNIGVYPESLTVDEQPLRTEEDWFVPPSIRSYPGDLFPQVLYSHFNQSNERLISYNVFIPRPVYSEYYVEEININRNLIRPGNNNNNTVSYNNNSINNIDDLSSDDITVVASSSLKIEVDDVVINNNNKPNISSSYNVFDPSKRNNNAKQRLNRNKNNLGKIITKDGRIIDPNKKYNSNSNNNNNLSIKRFDKSIRSNIDNINNYHIVKPGDYGGKIAEKYRNVRLIANLRKLNPDWRPNMKLNVGDMFRIK